MSGFHGKSLKNGNAHGKMKTRTSEIPLIKRLFAFLNVGFLTFFLIAPAALPPVTVYAASMATLKGLLIGLSMQLGVGNIDANSISYLNSNTVLNAPLENVGGENAIYTYEDINTALSSNEGVARWTSGFANTAEQIKVAQEYITQAGGDPSGLDGLGGASAGENIISSARFAYNNYKTNGNWDVRPSIGGQTMTDALNATAVMASMADVAYNYDNFIWYAREAGLTQEEIDACYDSGAAFGSLENAQDYLQNRNKTIVTGTGINISNTILNLMNDDSMLGSVTLVSNNNTYRDISMNSGQRLFTYFDSANSRRYFYCGSLQSGTFKRVSYTGSASDRTLSSKTTSYGNIYIGQGGTGGANQEGSVNYSGYIDLGTCSSSEFNNRVYLNFENDIEKNSPSLIGSQGQLSGSASQDPTTNQYHYNINVSPTANYVTNNYTLPDETDWQTFVSEVQSQIANNESQENIASTFAEFASTMATEIPVPTAAPSIPDQPTTAPKPTLTPEQEASNPELMATPELKDKFPFCIPWDIYAMFTKWESIEREAPHIEFDLDLGPGGVHHIDMDFEDFNDVAALLRLLELIVFAVGLAVATRKLIGAGGG